MIIITRLNNKEMVINADLIETIEENPDTTITMTTGRKIIAKQTSREIIDKVVEYKRKISYNHFIE